MFKQLEKAMNQAVDYKNFILFENFTFGDQQF